MPVAKRYLAEEVESDRVFQIGGVEVRRVFDPMARNVVQKVRCEVPMRVNDANTVAEDYVLKDQIAQKRRFPRAAFADG